MAVYAALISLTHTLHQILHPPPLNKITINTEQIELLRCKVNFTIDFLESHSSRRSHDIADLETKIGDAAYEAADVIESNVISQIQYKRITKKNSTLLFRGIQTVLEKFLSIEKELLKIKEKEGEEDLLPKTSRATSSRTFPGQKAIMVGSDKHLLKIMSELATDESNRRIVGIVGMGGIGKTTLATSVYNNSFIVEHFHVRAWITVSHEYTVRELLIHLLSELNKVCPSVKESTDEELGLQIHKELFDRKYLIVMDDMWNVQVWEKLRKFIPRNQNGSRILVTTRLSHLTVDFESCTPYVMEFLDEGQSWDLLRRKIFSSGNCPVELEGIGKGVAKRCSGLPLALVVIGGLLAKAGRRREHWESIAAALSEETDERLRKILSLSYIHLPLYLKPCFLYLAMFPEDFEVHVTMLVRLWVAEGLIRRNNEGKTLEEVAEEYVEELITRNLVLVHKRGSSGKVKSCKIHDLVRDLCVAEAEKQKFLRLAKLDDSIDLLNLETTRRLSVSSPGKAEMAAIEALRAAKMNRTWYSHDELFEAGWWTGRGSEEERSKVWMVNQMIHEFRLLNVVHLKDCDTPVDISKLCNVRYVVARSVSSISSLFLCWNLQTLVVDEIDVTLPAEIWKMPQLRHVMMYEIALPDPPDGGQNAIVLDNLTTLGTIENFKCTEEVWKRIPNLKKLRISYDFRSAAAEEDYCLQNLECFEKLESLGIQGAEKLWTEIRLPNSLKKVVLENCKIVWDDLSIVGKLPNLEVLKLYFHATEGEEWNPVEGEFCRLKFLLICASDLKIWGAESSHFPCIERLVLSGVMLEEIPVSFAEILMLEEIRLGAVHDSVWSSAREISQQRELLGYEPLQIRQV